MPLRLTNHDARLDRCIWWISLIGLILLFGYFLIYINHRFTRGHFGDFETFYRSGKAIREQRDPYVSKPGELPYVYPPLIACLSAPLTHVSLIAAEQIMLPINILCAVAALLLLAREMMERLEAPLRPGAWLAVCLLAGLLGENELRGQLQAMETDVVMLLAFTLCLRWLDRRPIWAGVALGVAMNIKYLSIVALPYLLLRRRWRAVGGLVVGTVGVALLPAVMLGWNKNLEYLRIALGGLLPWIGISSGKETATVHGIADGLSVSVTSAVARVMRTAGHPEHQALMVAGGIGLVCLGIAAIFYFVNRLPFLRWPPAREQMEQPYRGLVGIEWAILLGLMLAFSPDTNTRHLVMAMPLNVAAAVLVLMPRRSVATWPLWIGMGVMFVGFIMPLKGLCTDRFIHQYFRYGIVSWSMLTLCGTLLWVGLRSINVAPAKERGFQEFRPESLTKSHRYSAQVIAHTCGVIASITAGVAVNLGGPAGALPTGKAAGGGYLGGYLLGYVIVGPILVLHRRFVRRSSSGMEKPRRL